MRADAGGARRPWGHRQAVSGSFCRLPRAGVLGAGGCCRRGHRRQRESGRRRARPRDPQRHRREGAFTAHGGHLALAL